jgi:hypothetical protein
MTGASMERALTAAREKDRAPLGPDRYISLRQPWASLWVAGAKLIETRSWPTKFRGRLAVHASKTFGWDEIDACHRPVFANALAPLGITQPLDLPRGCVLGWVTITDCLEMGSTEFPIRPDLNPRLTPTEEAFGAYAWGRFAWITNRHRLTLPTPIPMKALQRVQRLPDDIAARMR